MADIVLSVESHTRLSPVARVVDTFFAPSKTFEDIHRNASWWLPCLLVVVVSIVYSMTAMKTVGLGRTSDNLIATMPKIQDMIANGKPDEAQAIHAKFESQVRSQFYSAPMVLIASGFLIAALFLLTANFAFGGSATYKGMLAMFWYSILPLIILSGLVSILLAAGVNTETFRVSNPIGTNPGYYLPEGSSPILMAALGFVDVFSIWIFCLQAMGTAVVARISLNKALAAVAIWWVLYSLIKIVPAMMFS